MADELIYNRVSWEDAPSENTPIDAENLNKMDKGIADVTEFVNQLSEQIDDMKENGTGGGSGVTTEMSQSLWTIMQKTAFVEALTEAELTAFKTAWGIGSSGDDSGDTEVTLSSISATYSGGEVTVGTALTDLTGITVTATYSDGSTATVTDYTLSGEIAEGSNTITVSYGGKTTTFTVTGVAESSGANETTAWDNASEYSFGGIVKNVRNAKVTGTFAYQTISTDYIQMFDTGLGDDWEGIFIMDEEGELTEATSRNQAYFIFVNKEYRFTKIYTVKQGKDLIGATDISSDSYLKVENGVYYAKSLYTSEGYQPFILGHTYRWFAW